MKHISLEINNYKIILLKLLKEQLKNDMTDFYKHFGIELKKWAKTSFYSYFFYPLN